MVEAAQRYTNDPRWQAEPDKAIKIYDEMLKVPELPSWAKAWALSSKASAFLIDKKPELAIQELKKVLDIPAPSPPSPLTDKLFVEQSAAFERLLKLTRGYTMADNRTAERRIFSSRRSRIARNKLVFPDPFSPMGQPKGGQPKGSVP